MQSVQGHAPAPVMNQNWDLFRIFLAVARAGSIASAAGQLAESPATVGRKLRELETALSATLFDRSISGVELTSCGGMILRRAEQIESEVLQISDAIAGNDETLAGTVTVTAPSGLGQSLLAPQLQELHNQHPDLKVRLLLSNSRLNLLNREADIAVRIGAPKQERLIARKLGDVQFGIYAAHTYLDDIGPFTRSADLEGHNVIAATGELAQTVQCREFSDLSTQCPIAMETDSIFGQLAAVKSGLGIAPFPKYLGQAQPDLQELLPGVLKAQAELWLLTHPDNSVSARVQTVLDFLTKVVKSSLECPAKAS